MMTQEKEFDFSEINRIVESIKALTDIEIEMVVDLARDNNLTDDPEGLKQTFLSIRGESNDSDA
jgi:hypothetical protein